MCFWRRISQQKLLILVLLGCSQKTRLISALLLLVHCKSKQPHRHQCLPLIVVHILILFLSHFFSGYMAPEYIVRGKLTEKADVYSFGVLVIEVVTGKRNNAFSQNSHSILQKVCSCISQTQLSLTSEHILIFLASFFIRSGILTGREMSPKQLIPQ